MNSKNSIKKYGLPRKKIMKKYGEIKLILDQGYKKTGKYINIFIQNSQKEKFAIMVTKKMGNAVKRNMVKRLIREIYRLHPNWFKEMRIVFYVKQVKIEFFALETEVKQLMTIS